MGLTSLQKRKMQEDGTGEMGESKEKRGCGGEPMGVF